MVVSCIALTVSRHATDDRHGPHPLTTSLLPAQAALSAVDVLAAFAEFGATANGPTCRPQLLPARVAAAPAEGAEEAAGITVGSCMDLEALWHPCARAGAGGAVVPNNLRLGTCAYISLVALLPDCCCVRPCQLCHPQT